MSFSPMKLKAFVLTAGLLAFGVTNAAYAELPGCRSNLDGQTRETGSKCTSKSYKFNRQPSCSCPGDKADATEKCQTPDKEAGKKKIKYSCQTPSS